MTTSLTMATVRARIFTLPGRPPFMMARDLAEFYQVKTKRIMEQVRRNPGRFPGDFIFELSEAEFARMYAHFAETSQGRRTDLTHYGFTREGALQLSSVLTGAVADDVSVMIIRTFAELERQAMNDAQAMILKLRTEETRRRPLRVQVINGVNAGYSLEQIRQMGTASGPRIEQAARECLALGLIDRLPAGMQPGLFDA